jgi:hypothetical protein
MEQRMYNRGIPLDPSNLAYKREMDALNEKYGNLKENARSQAVQMGGEEMARSYGIGLGSQQQRMAETSALQQMGSGYMGAPQLGFNASEYVQNNPAELWSQTRGQNQQYGLGMAQINANKEMAANALAAKKSEGGDELPT